MIRTRNTVFSFSGLLLSAALVLLVTAPGVPKTLESGSHAAASVSLDGTRLELACFSDGVACTRGADCCSGGCQSAKCGERSKLVETERSPL